MIAWIRRNRGTLIFSLSLAAAGLLVADLWKSGIASLTWLTTYKDAISSISSLLTAAVLVVGSVFSYFRFFRGRTLSLRAELELSISVHSIAESYFLHAITLKAKNVGNATIWNPVPHISLTRHAASGAAPAVEITDWDSEVPKDDRLVAVIDTGETVTFFAQQHTPVDIFAVTYAATLRADEGDMWQVCKTISNKATQ